MKGVLLPWVAGGLLATSAVVGQSPPVAAPTGQKSLAATMNVYVFPNAGQAPDQQSKDEGECYNWAVQNTGTDPFQLAQQSEQQKQQTEQQKQQAQAATKGAGVKGAVGGAAAGALIGEVASDDPGKGAAYGAAAGLVVARRQSHRAAAKSTQQAEAAGQQAQQATQEQLQNFKKAFSVCLESKQYMVKF
jgi:hypothetical protein